MLAGSRARIPLRGSGASTSHVLLEGFLTEFVHPREQVIRLWEHRERPEITWYAGGHTGFFRSRPVVRFVNEALVRSGLVRGSPTALRNS